MLRSVAITFAIIVIIFLVIAVIYSVISFYKNNEKIKYGDKAYFKEKKCNIFYIFYSVITFVLSLLSMIFGYLNGETNTIILLCFLNIVSIFLVFCCLSNYYVFRKKYQIIKTFQHDEFIKNDIETKIPFNDYLQDLKHDYLELGTSLVMNYL